MSFIASLRYLLLALILTLMGCRSAEEVTTLRLAHSMDMNHPVHKAMVRMAERLDQLSAGTMKIAIYPSGQLGNERELIELMQIGSLAMTKVSASPLEAFVPIMKVFNVPYIFKDRAHYLAVLDSDIGKRLLDAPIAARLKGLGYYDAGARSFYTVDKPVVHPSDLAGLKIRVQESATALAMVGALGGSPTPIAWGELYTALQQGVVDGAENNPPSFYLSRHYEVSKYLTLDEHTSVPDILLIGTFAWNGLNAQQQAWLQQAAVTSVAYQRELWRDESERALRAVEQAGVEIIRPDKAAFQSLVTAMHRSYQGTEIGDLITEMKRISDGRSQ